MMSYPTMKQIEKATQGELSIWHRFLDPPGKNDVSFLKEELDKMNLIVLRLGVVKPKVSKKTKKK